VRGRVDASEGFPRTPGIIASTNLIQQFQYGEGLSRLFAIKEKSPTPTLGSEIVPVVVVDELRPGGYPPRYRCSAGLQVITDAVNLAWVAVNCRGQIPSGNVQDKLVVHEIHIVHNVAGFTRFMLEIGYTSGVVGLAGGFATLNDSTADQPTVGQRRSDYTGILSGLSGDAGNGSFQEPLMIPPNVQYTIPGPFIIGQGELVGVHSAIAMGVGLLNGWFTCEEYPRP